MDVYKSHQVECGDRIAPGTVELEQSGQMRSASQQDSWLSGITTFLSEYAVRKYRGEIGAVECPQVSKKRE